MTDLKTWTTHDKSTWGDGPWQAEPDKAHWIAHGLDCLIVRNNFGALCGYVGVPRGHRCFEVDYNDLAYEGVYAHGGLTFSNRCQPRGADEARGICHPVEGAAHAEVWWLGFDCGHAGDLSPGYAPYLREHLGESYPHLANPFGEEYRDLPYVIAQVEGLALQLSLPGGPGELQA